MFYEALKEICDQKNTSPSAVCVALSLSKSHVTRWKGGAYPRVDTLIHIAKHLGVSPASLIPKE